MTQQAAEREIAGRYTVLDEIGRGGMGVVWLAEDRTIGRRVAIKELHLPAGVPVAERAVLEERVLREARAAGRLNDPSVVTVYDVLQEAGVTYIVMELIQAPTLFGIVRDQGPLPADQVARLAEQLLSALDAAHAAGVVHRDVKPSNIMVLPNGRVKLTDFGIAQSVDDPRLTSSGILLGSPTYLAPELIKGGRADAGSDRWALAASLFYAVEGYAAFERESTAATMYAIVHEVPYLTRCHGPLASAIMGLLNATPSARLSARQVHGLLTRATQAMPVTQSELTAPWTMPRPQPARRRRWPLVTAAIAAAAVLFAGGWFAGRAGQSPAAATDGARLPTMTYGSGGDLPVFDLNGGNCSTSRLAADREYTDSDSCDDPHEFEVLAAFDPARADDLSYPGEKRLTPLAESSCALYFASDLVVAGQRGGLSYRALVPTRASWGEERDGRRIFCVLADRDGGQLTGPVTNE